MKYLGRISGQGVLTWPGGADHPVGYDIECFYQHKNYRDRSNPLKITGQLTGLPASVPEAPEPRLTLADGRVVDILVTETEGGGVLDVDILTPMQEFIDRQPPGNGGVTRRR